MGIHRCFHGELRNELIPEALRKRPHLRYVCHVFVVVDTQRGLAGRLFEGCVRPLVSNNALENHLVVQAIEVADFVSDFSHASRRS